MRLRVLIFTFFSAFVLSGCFRVNVNVPNLPSGGADSPSQLPAGNGGWQDTAWSVLGYVLGAEHGYLYYAYDSLAYPDKPVHLAVRLQKVDGLKGVKDVTIGFFDKTGPIGKAVTDSDGRASAEWTPPKAGDYPFEARVLQVKDTDHAKALELTPAPLRVAARKKDAEFVVIDLDHTVVASSFFRVLLGGAKPMPESVRVTGRIAKRYSIIYLTHRPDVLTVKSKTWLAENDYPFGPLIVSQLKDAFGDSGKFKTGKLREVRKSFPGVKLGIGDKFSDAQAYVDNGLQAYLIPHYKRDKAKDLRKTASQIERLRDRGRLQVVDSWLQIEKGIFGGSTFRPRDYVGALKRRAKLLEAEEKRRKKAKDDDDDDD